MCDKFSTADLADKEALARDIERAVKLSAPEMNAPIFAPISLAALVAKVLPPLFYAVDELLPQGLALLVSSPKMGKSWLCLWLGLCTSTGRPFLGFQTNRCRVLYLALEDSERRLLTRSKRLLRGESPPDNFDIETRAPQLNNGLLEVLENYIKAHPDTRLIIVDTLAKIRGSTSTSSNAYSADYADMTSLKDFADTHGVCLLLVHHLRKMRDDTDVFNQISGTNGIFGAADTALVLSRAHRDDSDTVLSVSGRDVSLDDMQLTFDRDTCKWERQGTVAEMRAAQELADYEASPLVRTIKKLLEQGNGSWSGKASDLLLAASLFQFGFVADNARALSAQINKFESDLLERDGIRHTIDKSKTGSGGAMHCFERVADDFEVLDNDEPNPFEC